MEDRQLAFSRPTGPKTAPSCLRGSSAKPGQACSIRSSIPTSERDKFRTRLEREPDGKTCIYVTHRGMQEGLYTSERKDGNHLATTPSRDPELENRNSAPHHGQAGRERRAGSAVAKADKSPAATTSGLAHAWTPSTACPRCSWKKTLSAHGAALAALTAPALPVEDRDRSRGLYYVRYVDPKTPSRVQGLFSKIFSQGKRSRCARSQKYRIQVKSEGNKSQVSAQ